LTTHDAITVHVIDDDEALRDSLSWLLEAHGFRVKVHAAAADYLAAGRTAGSACLLLDVRMPGMSGVQLQDALLQRGDRTPIIFVTGHGDVPMAVEAVKKGAFDFVEKPFNEEQIVALIRRAVAQDAERRKHFEHELEHRKHMASLTAREREVLDLVVAGKLNKSIADELGISIKTVETHRARVMEKMQAKSLAELIQLTLGEH
jgi:FixJ family two-component response regulator